MKRLYRSRKNRMLGGVCGGIAEYFEIDPVIVRLIAVALFFVGGSAVLAYIIALIVIPYEPFEMAAGANKEAAPTAAAAPGRKPPRAPATPCPCSWASCSSSSAPFSCCTTCPSSIPFTAGPATIVRHFFWPSLLIVFGIFVIARGWKK